MKTLNGKMANIPTNLTAFTLSFGMYILHLIIGCLNHKMYCLVPNLGTCTGLHSVSECVYWGGGGVEVWRLRLEPLDA